MCRVCPHSPPLRCCALSLQSLYQKFVDASAEDPPAEFFAKMGGQNRDYNVDLIPKFIMADGAVTPRDACMHVASSSRVTRAAPRSTGEDVD